VHSPNTLNEAKVHQKKCNPYSLFWLRWNGQKTISRNCPFKRAEETGRSFNTTAEAAGKSLYNTIAEAAGKSLYNTTPEAAEDYLTIKQSRRILLLIVISNCLTQSGLSSGTVSTAANSFYWQLFPSHHPLNTLFSPAIINLRAQSIYRKT
jgi:hypothetical protein